jgi:hypothetical protein
MSPHLKERILRHLDPLPDDKAYQVLDFLEFLESKYAERQAPSPSIFTRFADGVEDTMRAGRISTAAISETMGFLNKAMGVLNGVAAAGKSMATDIVSAAGSVSKPSLPDGSAGETKGAEPKPETK